MEVKPAQTAGQPPKNRSFFSKVRQKTRNMVLWTLMGATLGIGASRIFQKTELSTVRVFDPNKEYTLKVDKLPTDAVYETEVQKWAGRGVIDNSTLSGIAAQLIAKELGRQPGTDMFREHLDAVMHLVRAMAKDNAITNPNLVYPGSRIRVADKDVLKAAEMMNGGPITVSTTTKGGYESTTHSETHPNYVWVLVGAAAGALAGGAANRKRGKGDGAGGTGGPAQSDGGAPPFVPPAPRYNKAKIKSFAQIKDIDEPALKKIQAQAKKEYSKDKELKKKYKTYEKYESKIAKTVAVVANVDAYLKESEEAKKEALEAAEAPKKIEEARKQARKLADEAAEIKKALEPVNGVYPDPEQIQINKKLAGEKEKQAQEKSAEAQKLEEGMKSLLDKFQNAQEFSHIEDALRDLANRLRGRKVTKSMLMAIEQLTGASINLEDPALKNPIADIRSVAEDCIKSTAANGGNRVYLWRDGAFFWFADMLLSGKKEAEKAKSLLMPRPMLTGPDFGFSYDQEIKSDLACKAAQTISSQHGNLSDMEKQSKYLEVYDKIFREKFKSDGKFRGSVMKLYEYMKNNGSVETGPDGRIAPQGFVAADTGFISFPPFVKSVVEVCAEEVDKLKPGEVKGAVYYHTTDGSISYMPHLGSQKSSLGTLEGLGENEAFLDSTQGLVGGSVKPKINKGSDYKIKRSLAFFLSIAAKINEHEPEAA